MWCLLLFACVRDAATPSQKAPTTPPSPSATPTTDSSTETQDSGTSDSTSFVAFVSCEGDTPAHEVFNAFWQDFDARYAVFDVRLPDSTWAAEGAKACEALGDGSLDDNALYDVLLDLARTLDDGHVNLLATDLGRGDDAWVSVYPYLSEVDRLEFGVEANYLDGPLTWAANDWFAWGTIGGPAGVGYLSITSLDELSSSGNEGADWQQAMAAMDAVLADLAGTRGLVVDVRANGGGWDLVGLAVAERFEGPEAEVWSLTRRNGPAHDDFDDWFVQLAAAGQADAYQQPVVLLTSGATFSAAETFTLAMRERSQVTIVGEPTSGHFSDLVVAQLPNGWSYSFSGLRYRAPDGEIYEARGVPVDVSVPFDVAAAKGGQDVMLEAGLAQLEP